LRAVVISTPGQFSVTDVPEPSPRAGELIVAPRAVGICGTDLHIVDGEFPPAPYPLIPGHEFAGEVVALGADVDGVRVGDRVAVDPSLFCGQCRYCRRQRGNLCEKWGAIGDTVDGAFAELVRVPARNAWPIGEAMSWAAGALVEPLSCVVHGLRRARMQPGSELLIVGAGTIGLLHLQAARYGGAASIAVVDTDPARRRLAEHFGADVVADSVASLVEDRHGVGYEYVIEATGVPAAVSSALDGVCRGGVLLVLGVAPADATVAVSPFQIYNDEISIIGSMAVLDTFEPALRIMQAGQVRADEMVTLSAPLENFGVALEAVRSRSGLKTQVVLT
jgi:2-desacetyl-2-hydroxyethyl bacteriochlorophyllide A dehydrogenase